MNTHLTQPDAFAAGRRADRFRRRAALAAAAALSLAGPFAAAGLLAAPATQPATQPSGLLDWQPVLPDARPQAQAGDELRPFVLGGDAATTAPAAEFVITDFATSPAPIAAPAPAAQGGDTVKIVEADNAGDGTLRLTVSDSRVIRTTVPYHRVSVSSPEVADVNPLGPTTLLVSAKRPGSTQVVLWDAAEQSQSLLVQAGADLRVVQEQLEKLLPGQRVEAVDLNGTIALRGWVRDLAAAEKAESVAASYGPVKNYLEIRGQQQVLLEIRFAEVSRSTNKQFGVNFGFTDGQGTIAGSNIGQISPLSFFRDDNDAIIGLGVPDPTAATQFFGAGSINGDPFAYFVNALRESNLLRVLAEPNLVAISGEEAEFLAGGEFPIPVPQREFVTIEYRQFGVRLKYLPVVLGDGRIRLRVNPEVSDLDYGSSVTILGTQVPGLRKRELSTTVELADGQTFAIGGLLSSSATSRKAAVPLVGDVPILGALFRSTRYQRSETELVILVTPRLVSPLNPDEVPPLPGEDWKHPNELELFLLGQLGGEASPGDPRPTGNNAPAGQRRRPGLQASYTFTPPPQSPSAKADE